MKKIIVMLLVLAVFVGGVFADVYGTPEKVGPKEGMATGSGNTISDAATMEMKYTPYEGTAYYVFGFDVEGNKVTDSSTSHTSEISNDHLIIAGDFTGDKTMALDAKTEGRIVYGKKTFNVFYEFVTAEEVSLDIAFDANLTGADKTTTLDYDVYEGKSDEGTHIVDDKKANVFTRASDDANLVKGIKSYYVETVDASPLKLQTYTATVTLSLTTK